MCTVQPANTCSPLQAECWVVRLADGASGVVLTNCDCIALQRDVDDHHSSLVWCAPLSCIVTVVLQYCWALWSLSSLLRRPSPGRPGSIGLQDVPPASRHEPSPRQTDQRPAAMAQDLQDALLQAAGLQLRAALELASAGLRKYRLQLLRYGAPR